MKTVIQVWQNGLKMGQFDAPLTYNRVSPLTVETIDSPELHDVLSNQTARDILIDFAQQLMKQGRKIEAIKIVRQYTGWGLKEAKDFVETL